MPAGLLQVVGETGWQLSHGERSRLYIARALLQGADLLILDESFAALDPATLRRTLAFVIERAPTVLVLAHPWRRARGHAAGRRERPPSSGRGSDVQPPGRHGLDDGPRPGVREQPGLPVHDGDRDVAPEDRLEGRGQPPDLVPPLEQHARVPLGQFAP